jgi:hypothetical protein
MEPTMRAARFLVSPLLSRRPLCTTGTTSARLGASMVLTNVVDSSVSRQGRVDALGSAIAASSAGTSAAISGLLMTLPTCTRATHACVHACVGDGGVGVACCAGGPRGVAQRSDQRGCRVLTGCGSARILQPHSC